MLELNSQLRTDIYYVEDVMLDPTRIYDGTTGRVVPQVTGSWRYPLVKQFESTQLIIEPLANLTLSPNGGNPSKIPNEDSFTPEFNDLNIFSSDRFPGYDRVESGPRVNYGMRAHADFNSGSYASLLLGQDYRLNNDPLFPLTNDLNDNFSDYIGRMEVGYNPLDVTYRFRLGKDDFEPKRHEVNSTLTFEQFYLSGAYVKLNDDPSIGSREDLYGGASVKLNKEWTTSISARQNLENDSATYAGLGLMFNNECLTLLTSVNRSLTTDRDIEADTSFPRTGHLQGPELALLS
jgi:LPS-assembly protein